MKLLRELWALWLLNWYTVCIRTQLGKYGQIYPFARIWPYILPLVLIRIQYTVCLFRTLNLLTPMQCSVGRWWECDMWSCLSHMSRAGKVSMLAWVREYKGRWREATSNLPEPGTETLKLWVTFELLVTAKRKGKKRNNKIPQLSLFSLHGNGDTIRIGQELQCPPYARFSKNRPLGPILS